MSRAGIATGDELELVIIVVNWNSLAYLRQCLHSLRSEAMRATWKVVVVDNASAELGLDEIPRDFPFVHLIRLDKNRGFAAANNLGFRSVRAHYVLFLNPDTEVIGSAIADMLTFLKEHSDVAVVGCRLLNSDGTLQVSCVQRYPRVWNQLVGTDALLKRLSAVRGHTWSAPSGAIAQALKVEVVSGACMMLRGEVFEQVGMFSEDYFMYAEDVDLCYKISQTQRSCYHVPTARVIHHGGGCSRLRPAKAWAAVVQCGAKLQFVTKTRGVAYGQLYRVAVALGAATRWLIITSLIRLHLEHDKDHYLRAAREKWAEILKWTVRSEQVRRRLIGAE